MHIGGNFSLRKNEQLPAQETKTKNTNKLTQLPQHKLIQNVYEIACSSALVEAVFLVKLSPN